MIDEVRWVKGICDICRKDESVLQPRLIGIIENGRWVDGYSKENADKARAIQMKWEQEITGPCIAFYCYEDVATICEKHLAEVVAKKSEFIKQGD